MGRILVLRSGGAELPQGAAGPDVTLLTTHEIVPMDAGIAEALAFDPRGARLIVSSRVTAEILLGGTKETEVTAHGRSASGEAGAGANRTDFFERGFSEVIAAGEETARSVRQAQSPRGDSTHDPTASPPAVVVPPLPGASGVLHLLRESPGGLSGLRILWPRGSDADAAPVDELRRLGADVVAPVVYEKRTRRVASLTEAERTALSEFRGGGFAAVVAGSMAALEALLSWLGHPAPAALPRVRWGVLGPETARAVSARGLPSPAVPQRARFEDLIDLLRKELAKTS
ncbi:MAG: uroporphyrinogen-III synthase [Acidithiobacillales bacterium]